MRPRKEVDKLELETVPPDYLRCRRSDGKQWRCKGYKVEGKSMCEKHLSSVVKKRRRKYIARSETSDSGEKTDDLSEIEEDKPVKKFRFPETKIRRNGKGCDENEAVTSLRIMKDSLGEGDKKKKHGNEEKACSNLIKSTEKYARTESSSSKGKDRMKVIKMISLEEEEHGEGEKLSRVVKKSRLKGKSILSDEENNGGDFYDSKRKHSAKSREPITKGVESSESLLRRNDRKLTKKKKVEVVLEKQDDDGQNDCKNPKGKQNGEVTRKSDKGKSKKVDRRRKHFSTDVPYDDCQMCHQCMKSDRKVVRCEKVDKCEKRCRKRYCSPCIERWYPHLSEEAIAEKCPVCRGNCNCKDCLRKNFIPKEPKYLGIPQENNENIKCLNYLVNALYPFLITFFHDQNTEKEMEASIKGLSLTRLTIPEAALYKVERVYCNNCNTSIVDLHRTCTTCSYDLCLTCCQEIREGCFLGDCADEDRRHPEWRATETGDIPCPPKERGGCGNNCLELKRLLGEKQVEQIMREVENLVKANSYASETRPVEEQCTCNSENRRKAASRSHSDDNYLFCPSSDIQEG